MTKTTYEYPNADGVALFKVVRTDFDDARPKKFMQFHREKASAAWVPKAPPWPRPVWMLPEIDWLPDRSPILVVEGEKAAKAAQALFGSKLTVTTWSGGVSAVGKTDWGPLKRHRVVCWPDLDQHTFPEAHTHAGTVMPFMMQPGTKAMSQVVLATGGALVNVPGEFIEAASRVTPSGWDLADEMPQGYSLKDLAAWIRRALEGVNDRMAIPPPPDHVADNNVVPATRPINSPLVGAHMPALMLEGLNLITTARGAVKPLTANVVAFVRGNDRWMSLRYNEFTNQAMLSDRELTDADLRREVVVCQRGGLHFGSPVIKEGILTAAEENSFHPVREYLSALVWDEVPRIEHILIDAGGAPDNEYVKEVTKRWFISGVARIMSPGCKADHMLVLEGKQGLGKSRFFSTVAGEYFTDHLSDLTSKDARQELRNGVWVCELAELSSIKRASDISHVKNFLTTRVDNYRDSYGRTSENHKRQCIFAGTVNPGSNGWMTDETGGRRFWPVSIKHHVDIDLITEVRDQLWAEAMSYFRAGEIWWLRGEEIEAVAEKEQAERLEMHVWQGPIGDWLERERPTHPTVDDVLRGALKLDSPADWTHKMAIDVGKCMHALGWHSVPLKRGARRVYLKNTDHN